MRLLKILFRNQFTAFVKDEGYSAGTFNGRRYQKILERALTDKEKGYGSEGITVTAEALEALADFAGGDARVALNLLEQAEFMLPDGSKEITMDVLRSVAGNALQRYDKR